MAKNEYTINKSYKETVYSKAWEELRDKNYFEYRKNWSYLPTNKIISDFPLHLDIETTNACNLKCPMCARTILIKQNQFSKIGFMTKEEFASIVDQGAKYGAASIKLNYLGEPLMHKDVVWQVKYAKKKGIIDVMMNTNGVLLTKELSIKLLNAGLDKLFVSFDAVNPEMYEKIRIGSSLGKVIDNIYTFVKLRNEISPKTHIRLSMVMYPGDIWVEQFNAIKVMWRNLVDAIGYDIFNERDDSRKKVYAKNPKFYCEQLFQRMFLKYNGNISVCCVDDKDNYIVGNWKRDDLKEVWNNKKYKAIREKHMAGDYDFIDICKNCFYPDIDR